MIPIGIRAYPDRATVSRSGYEFTKTGREKNWLTGGLWDLKCVVDLAKLHDTFGSRRHVVLSTSEINAENIFGTP